MLIRIDNYLSKSLNISRSDAKDLLSKHSILVNGQVVKSSNLKVDPEIDKILVNGVSTSYKKFRYFVLNKPLGYVSSTDSKDGKTVVSLLDEQYQRLNIFPAGRLDKYSEGMMILTNDGDFAHRILSPSHHLPKQYYVRLDAPIINKELVELFSKGVYLGGGKYSSPSQLEIINSTTGLVTIYEGIYHQVKRMFDQNGAHVIELKRLKIGNLSLDSSLAPGEYRELTDEELKILEGNMENGQEK